MTRATAKDDGRLMDYRKLIARLPVTMRPSLNQQVTNWDSLFPFEQNQLAAFVSGIASLSPSALAALIQPLQSLEIKMGVAQWDFSQASDTMENASLLARSAYYADWRREVQRIFEAVSAAARDAASPQPDRPRLILIVLPASLPVDPIHQWKSWDPRGQEIQLSGDARSLSELLLKGRSDQPGLVSLLASKEGAEQSGLWLIDADAEFDRLLSPAERQSACSLNYAVLKSFRDRFLAQVNTVPKNIAATDQTLTAMRQEDWERWWPAELTGETRLRNFVVNLFLSGNGALIFSNAFVEWASSEALRRARPQVVVARFGLRAKPKPFTGIAIFENQQRISALPDIDDPVGSAVDATILARYIWLAAQRYPEQEQTCCLCISEYRNAVYLIAPRDVTLPWRPGESATAEEVSRWIKARFVS